MSHKHKHHQFNAQNPNQREPEEVAPDVVAPEEQPAQPEQPAPEPLAAPAVAEAPAAPEQPKEPVEQPVVTITPQESVVAPKKPQPQKEKIMSADLLKPKTDPRNVFQTRRAANSVATKHTAVGTRLLGLLADYRRRMSTPSTDRNENMLRIRMLQNIVNVACPQIPLDMQTATDVARIMFDEFMNGWGTVYDDTTIFRLGNTLKGTAYEFDKMVIFIEAFIQMVEGVAEKKKILFDDARITKVLRNNNVATAMCRIRDNINTRNGFPVIAR